ncbi:MAG: type IV pilus modification PilV family protein [Aureliella sp.]
MTISNHQRPCPPQAGHAPRCCGPGHRSGMTILEVLFAIGIVVIGLLGIASLLPLAGHQASEAARAAEAQALAQDWYSELFTRQIHRSDSWIFYQDISGTVGGVTFTPGYTNYNANINAIKFGTPPTGMTRVTNKQAVCIDPMFFAEADMQSATGSTPLAFVQPAPATNRWYRPSVFPYYQDRYNPTIDPAYVPSTSVAWGDQPRMVRVTFSNGASSPAPAAAKYVEQVFASQDELSMTVDQKDRSAAPVRTPTLYAALPTSGTAWPIARAASRTDYSWLATLSPNETLDNRPVDYGTLSLVVMYKRDRLFFNPKDSATVPALRAGDPTPESKPLGERVAWVVPISGDFSGGTGGRVRLLASDGVPDTLHIGNWVMLSKYVSASGGAAHPVFRWYRVVSCDAPRLAPFTDPSADFLQGANQVPAKNFPSTAGKDPYGLVPPSSDQVWSRDVVLDGPDWDFGLYYPPGTTTFTTPTTATLLQGAVAVIERVVEIK